MAARKPPLAHWRDALRDSTLGEKAKLAGFVMSTYSNSHGHCYPGKAAIAKGMSVKSTRTADTAVAELERGSFVRVTRSSGGRRSDGTGISNRYQLVIPTPQGVAGFEDFNPATQASQPRKTRRATLQPAAPESGNPKAKSESVVTKVAEQTYDGTTVGVGSDGHLYNLDADGGLILYDEYIPF